MGEWQERANRRRDERHTAGEIRRPSGSKKDTKKWCRGKVGVKHDPVCADYNTLKRATFAPEWKVLVCRNCGKELDNYWPTRFFKSNKPKPDWVV